MGKALEQQGHEAFIDEDFTKALDLYSQAVAAEPSDPSPLVSRAQVHIKLGNYTDAIADAKKAIELNPNLPKAYLRKGIACFHLEEYETAKAAFVKGAALEDGSSFQSWIRKCDEKFRAESGTGTSLEVANDTDVVMTPAAPEPAPPRPSKYRHEWYQSQTAVVVTIYAKGINPDQATIQFGEQMLSVVINVPNEEPYVLQTRLYGKVSVAKCKYEILSTKIEIRLVKADETHWKALAFEENQEAVLKAPAKEISTYPSSSKKAATKNWDKVEAEVKKEEKDEKLEGDAALNKLFREIYSNADEDTRRAMNKSFVESSGTVLSTNWKEVGAKKVEGSAPQGMEMKKWEM